MLNRVSLMGRLTHNPEVRRTANGTAVTSFSLAVERDFKGQDGEKQTDFIDCVAWRQTAEFIGNYFTKGRMIAVDGTLQIRQWTDKEGHSRKTAEVLANSVYFCGDKPRDGGGNESAFTAAEPAKPVPISDDGDLPF